MTLRTARPGGDHGFAIITVLFIVGVASAVIVGGSKTAASVLDERDTRQATVQMRAVAKVIRDRGTEIGGTAGDALRGRARRIVKIANAMDDRAMDAVVGDVAGNLGDAVLTPLQGGKVIEAVKFAWDVKGNVDLADTTLKAWGVTDAAVDPAIAELQALTPQTDFGLPVEQAIVEAKVTATRNAVAAADPGLSPEEIEAAVVPSLLGIEAATLGAPPPTDPFSNPFWLEVTGYLGAPPSTGTTVTTSTTLGPILEPSDYMDLWADFTPYEGGATVEWRITNLSVDTIYGVVFSVPPPDIEGPGGAVLGPGESASGWFEISIEPGASWRFTTDARGELSDGTPVYSNLIDVAVHGE